MSKKNDITNETKKDTSIRTEVKDGMGNKQNTQQAMIPLTNVGINFERMAERTDAWIKNEATGQIDQFRGTHHQNLFIDYQRLEGMSGEHEHRTEKCCQTYSYKSKKWKEAVTCSKPISQQRNDQIALRVLVQCRRTDDLLQEHRWNFSKCTFDGSECLFAVLNV